MKSLLGLEVDWNHPRQAVRIVLVIEGQEIGCPSLAKTDLEL